MEVRLIIAVLRRDKLEEVERALREIDVERIDVSTIKGYGEYRNFFTQDWMTDEVRLEIFTKKNEVESITNAIMGAAHTGLPGDGVVAVVPIDTLYLIRTRAEATPEEFWPPQH